MLIRPAIVLFAIDAVLAMQRAMHAQRDKK